ncbi:MAG: PASTA domain-containing protein [Paludibacteraceae bacterium]|nr:PASTA domain-containing protein [Paludibacteraceae bacterium]
MSEKPTNNLLKKAMSFLNHTAWGYVVKNLVILLIVIFVLVTLAGMFANLYTHHGESEIVPELKGMQLNDAVKLLEEQGLNYEITDSVYDRKIERGIVVEQSPVGGNTVKNSRIIYLTINAFSPRQVPIPDIRDMSYRQAEATLKAAGFVIGEVKREPSEYRDLVLDIKHNNLSISSGTRLNEGSTLTLIIGNGDGDGELRVPNLIGLTLTEAYSELSGSLLTIGGTDYDEEPDSLTTYYIYWQNPPAYNMASEGSRINVKLSADKDKTLFDESEDDDIFF